VKGGREGRGERGEREREREKNVMCVIGQVGPQ